MNDPEATAKQVIDEFLRVRDDVVGLVLDHESPVTQAFRSVLNDYDHRIIRIPADRANSGPIPEAYDTLQECDAVVAPTKKSITHSPETTKLRQEGKRFITLPSITPEIFRKIREADMDDIVAREDPLLDQVREAQEIHIATPSGTDLTLELDPDRPWHRSTAKVEPGGVGNLPTGEIFTAPLENGADGTIVIDVWHDIRTDDHARIRVEHGKITEWTEGAQPYVDVLREGGENGLVIAELGIGTNKAHTEPMGNTLHDEKMYGTCHVAFGLNTSFGGENEADVHQDVVLDDPTITADGEELEY